MTGIKNLHFDQHIKLSRHQKKKKGGGEKKSQALVEQDGEGGRRKQNVARLYEMALEDRTTAVCACSAHVCKNKVRRNDGDEGA